MRKVGVSADTADAINIGEWLDTVLNNAQQQDVATQQLPLGGEIEDENDDIAVENLSTTVQEQEQAANDEGDAESTSQQHESTAIEETLSEDSGPWGLDEDVVPHEGNSIIEPAASAQPRRSERSNKGVPAEMFLDMAYLIKN